MRDESTTAHHIGGFADSERLSFYTGIRQCSSYMVSISCRVWKVSKESILENSMTASCPPIVDEGHPSMLPVQPIVRCMNMLIPGRMQCRVPWPF